MKELHFLAENATENEVKEAVANLPAPGPLRIAKALEVKDLKKNKFQNMHEIFEGAALSEIIEAFNLLQYAKAGNMKIFKSIFSIENIQAVLPYFGMIAEAFADGKITQDEIKEFLNHKN